MNDNDLVLVRRGALEECLYLAEPDLWGDDARTLSDAVDGPAAYVILQELGWTPPPGHPLAT